MPVQTFEQNRYALIIYTDKPYDHTAALLEQCLCAYIIIAITNNDRVACSHMQSFRSSSTGKPGHYGWWYGMQCWFDNAHWAGYTWGVQCIRKLEWSSNPLVNLTYLTVHYPWTLATFDRPQCNVGGLMQFSALGDIAWMNVKQCMCELCRSRGASEADRPHLRITPWHLWPTVYSPKVCPYYRHRWHCVSNSCEVERWLLLLLYSHAPPGERPDTSHLYVIAVYNSASQPKHADNVYILYTHIGHVAVQMHSQPIDTIVYN